MGEKKNKNERKKLSIIQYGRGFKFDIPLNDVRTLNKNSFIAKKSDFPGFFFHPSN